MEAEALLAVKRAAQQQAQPDDAGQDDHHGGEDGVAGERRRVRTARQHQRHDQRDFDHGDRDRQHQRAERLAHAMRDHLGVVHGGQHGADQPGRDEHQEGAAESEQRSAEEEPGDDRRGEGPERQERRRFHSATIAHATRHPLRGRPHARSSTGRPASTENFASVSIAVSRRVTSSTTRSDVVSRLGVNSTTP